MADGNALQRAFLRKILYRIDFQLITEKIQEELFQYVAEKYSPFFSNQRNELENSVDIEINPLSSNIPKMNTRRQNVFVLTHPKKKGEDGRTIKIGKTFILLELDLDIVSHNISYYEWFSDIIAHIKENAMFRAVRIALRKFNLFYILDEHKQYLNDIFQISFLKETNVDKFELEQMNEVQVYNISKYKLNFSREYSTGILNNNNINNKLAHLIAFDFDLYSTQSDIINQFIESPKEGLIEMNENIYKFFTSIIKDDIITKINKGELLEQFKIIIPF